MSIIFTIGIFSSLFYFILLINKKNRSTPDGILASWMLIIAIHLISTYLQIEGYWEIYPHLIGITVPFPFFYGIMLYLYVAYSLKGTKQIRQRDYLHFLPVLITYAYMSRFYFMYSAEEKRAIDETMTNSELFSIIVLTAFIGSAIGYAWYSYRLLQRHQKLIEANFSNLTYINLNWLKSFIWVVALIFLTVLIVLLSRDIMGFSYPFYADNIFYALIVFAVLSLGYFGIRHQNIFSDNEVLDTHETKGTYLKSSLKQDLAAQKHQELIELMESQKPYLEPDLSLNALAERLDISLHHLSQIINQFEDQNFNDFVNKYRVEEFIDNALQNPHHSFLAIALDSGFNSKSTFNTVFRKQKGVTPSEFIATRLKKAS